MQNTKPICCVLVHSHPGLSFQRNGIYFFFPDVNFLTPGLYKLKRSMFQKQLYTEKEHFSVSYQVDFLLSSCCKAQTCLLCRSCGNYQKKPTTQLPNKQECQNASIQRTSTVPPLSRRNIILSYRETGKLTTSQGNTTQQK